MTPEQRIQRARLAAHVMHAEGKTNTGPANKAFMARFEREVDPEGILDPAERARRAAHARKAYFLRLSMKAAASRRKANGAA